MSLIIPGRVGSARDPGAAPCWASGMRRWLNQRTGVDKPKTRAEPDEMAK